MTNSARSRERQRDSRAGVHTMDDFSASAGRAKPDRAGARDNAALNNALLSQTGRAARQSLPGAALSTAAAPPHLGMERRVVS